MKYTIKAHETEYAGVMLRSRLEARWACFFDLVGWNWEYEPIDLDGWTPDFRVEFSCSHSECPDSHVLLAEVKPYYSIEEFKGHPCMDYPFGRTCGHGQERRIPADASAAFGINPRVTYFEMAHGSGGGCLSVEFFTEYCWDIDELWKQAGNVVQWRKD